MFTPWLIYRVALHPGMKFMDIAQDETLFGILEILMRTYPTKCGDCAQFVAIKGCRWGIKTLFQKPFLHQVIFEIWTMENEFQKNGSHREIFPFERIMAFPLYH
jgi:hypothetical protein